MIIKGGSRGGPAQLAWHLQRHDTNESVKILELQSLVPDLAEAFRDWQTLSEGTRGTKGLYHANIDPAEQYSMTAEQWKHAVDVLEKELGFEGQPRAIVLHQKYGREHLHVVWARTDIDEMILRSDSQNYQAHERASQRLEMEFGHEAVPGKHAKRDRDKQKEFPRSESNHAEWQQGERTGITAAERKMQITALKQACDGAVAFRAALEEQGYILATGRRDFVLVDETGNVYSLARQIRGMKAAELREFMKGIEPTLPAVEQAKETQKERRQQKPQEVMAPRDPESAKQAEELAKAEADAIRKRSAEQYAEEKRRLEEFHAKELEKFRQAVARERQEKLERLDVQHRAQGEALRQRQEATHVTGVLGSIQDVLFPAQMAERAAAEQRAREQLAARQEEQRAEQSLKTAQVNQAEIEKLAEHQRQELRDLAAKAEKDLERRLREQETTRKLRAEVEEIERRERHDAPEQKQAPDAAAPTKDPSAGVQPDLETQVRDLRGKQLEDLKEFLPKQRAKDLQEWLDVRAEELKAKEQQLAQARQKQQEEFAAAQEREMAALQQRHEREASSVTEAVRSRLNPEFAAEQAERRRQEIERLEQQQAWDLRQNNLRLMGERETALHEFKEQQDEERRAHTLKVLEYAERNLREEDAVRKLREEVEEIERREREEQLKRDGPDPPTHTR